MPDIRFYNLSKTSVFEALPRLLQKAFENNINGSVILKRSIIAEMSSSLWGYGNTTFLAHEVCLLDTDSTVTPPPNFTPYILSDKVIETSKVRFFVDNLSSDNIVGSDVVFYIFNGLDDVTLKNARILWKELQSKKSCSLVYYQQNSKGVWQKNG